MEVLRPRAPVGVGGIHRDEAEQQICSSGGDTDLGSLSEVTPPFIFSTFSPLASRRCGTTGWLAVAPHRSSLNPRFRVRKYAFWKDGSNAPRFGTLTPVTRWHVTASFCRVTEVCVLSFLLIWPFRRVPQIQETPGGEVTCTALREDASRARWSFRDSAHPAESTEDDRAAPLGVRSSEVTGRREGRRSWPYGPCLPPWMCAT